MRHRFLGEMEGAFAKAVADRALEQIESDGRLLPVLQCRRAGVLTGLAFTCPREAEAAFLLARHSSMILGACSPAQSGAGRMGWSWCSRFRGSAPVVPQGPGRRYQRRRNTTFASIVPSYRPGALRQPRFTLVLMLDQAVQGATTFDGRLGQLDRRGRALRDLRISVTDRCNFRCPYCMPGDVFGRDYQFLPRDEILSYEEIHRLAEVFVGLGVHKLRITGGEPTVRRGLPGLVAMLAPLRTPADEPVDLALTTNRSALRHLARPLADAGLRRVTVSLDSLDDEVFRRMNGVAFPVAKVLDGIDAAVEAGL